MLPIQYKKHPRAKHYRITIKSDHIRVTIPKWGSQKKAESFVETKKEWIEHHAGKLKASPLPPVSETEIEFMRAQAKEYIPDRVEVLADEFGFTFNDIRIKNIRSRWGSCSRRKNLNFSLHLMRLEKKYIDYVILHELSHAIVLWEWYKSGRKDKQPAPHGGEWRRLYRSLRKHFKLISQE